MNPTAQIPTEQPEENKIAGTLGAFLFALAGGLAYFALWQLGFIAAISGNGNKAWEWKTCSAP